MSSTPMKQPPIAPLDQTEQTLPKGEAEDDIPSAKAVAEVVAEAVAEEEAMVEEEFPSQGEDITAKISCLANTPIPSPETAPRHENS